MQSISRLLTIDAAVVSNRLELLKTLPRLRQGRHCTLRHDEHTLMSRRLAVHNASSPEADPAQPPPLPPACTSAYGQVMAAQANFVRVKIDRLEDAAAGPPPRSQLLCVVRALLKKIKQNVLVGDRVRVVGIDWTDGRGMVEGVAPRNSRLKEPPVANVNHVLLVFSTAMPPLQPSAATRYLIAAEAAGLPVTVVLNKADLVDEEEAAAQEERVAGWGYKTLRMSVVDARGIEALEVVLKDKVTVVAGPSGAGKSSIINALRLRAAGGTGTLEAMAAAPSSLVAIEEYEEEEECCGEDGVEKAEITARPEVELQAVGAVSQRIGRGKHTTRNVTLMELGCGGLVVDTPGFNQPSVELPPGELARHFPEVRAALERSRCAFSDCQHLAEPGCAVRGDWERYGLYVDLHAELVVLEEVMGKRADAKRRREGMVRFKSRVGGQQGLEARLETKSHRRVSRRSVRQQLSEAVKDVDDVDAPP